MSRVRKCDRCGKYYEPQYGETTVIGVTTFNLDNEEVSVEEYKDLCPECDASFLVWLNEIGYEDIPGDVNE